MIKFPLLLPMCLLVLGCSPPAPSRSDVIKSSVKSPDGRFVAEVRLPSPPSQLGATMSTRYQVFVTSLMPELKDSVLVIDAEKTEGFEVKWLDANRLQICYGKAYIGRFVNHAEMLGEKTPLYSVEITLLRKNNLADCVTSF